MADSVACLSCDAAVRLPEPIELAEILACGDCGQELEVIETEPSVRVDFAPEVEEDWGE
ncbi:hypothetical protein ACWEOI_23805 [Nocardia sp. NPDC004340]